MPYTNAWSSTIPLGSADPGTIDDVVRQLRLDIEERMNDVVADWTVDPVVLDVSTVGTQTGVVIMYHHTILQPRQDDDDVGYEGAGLGEYFLSDNETGKTAFGALNFPVGSTLTNFEATIDVGGGGDLDMRIAYITSGTGARTLVSTISQATSGIRTMDTGTISHPVLTNRAYYVHFDNTTSVRYRIYAMKATIDVTGLVGYIG